MSYLDLELWIASLRARGVKAAIPDGIHVNHMQRRATLREAFFDDGVSIGSLVMIGSAGDVNRLVRVTTVGGAGGSPHLSITFEDLHVVAALPKASVMLAVGDHRGPKRIIGEIEPGVPLTIAYTTQGVGESPPKFIYRESRWWWRIKQWFKGA